MKLSQLAGLTLNRLKNLGANLRAAEPARLQELPPQAEKDWTVLVYMEGRHRLAHSTDLGLNKLEQMGSTDKIHVAVQATQVPAWQERILPNMQSLPTRRYWIQADQDPGQVHSPVLEEMPDSLPLNSENLADFVAWGMEKFPSRKVMLVIKKHGAGFARISQDEETFAPLSARETEAALERVKARTGRNVDVVAFDSCSMQQMEVAYQLRKHASVMTGSQEDIKAIAYPYGSLVQNLDRAGEVSAEEAGRLLVATYADKVKTGMHSAADLKSLEATAAKVRRFVEVVEGLQISPSRLYTSMLDTRPMERTQVLALQHNFRDLGSFFQQVASDSEYPTALREAAREAAQAVEDSVLGRFASEGAKRLKNPTGLTGFLPWRQLSPSLRETYQQLDWAQDSGWGRFLDYVFEAPGSGPKAAPEPPSSSTPLSLSQRLGKWGLYQYKKYISPYLNVTCSYTPSCSQFAREAIEKHGLWEGGKQGALRFFSCNGLTSGHDPLKDSGHVCGSDCKEHHQNPALAKILVEPVRQVVTPEQFSRHRGWIGLAQKVGLAVGGLGLAALSLPFGAAVGAWTGYQAGSGQIQTRIDEMAGRYNPSVVRGFLNIAEPLGGPAARVHDKLHEQSPLLARCLGGVTGAAMGLAMGALGAAWQGFQWGKTFGGLWAGNRVADALGHLPPHPETEAILRQDYQRAS